MLLSYAICLAAPAGEQTAGSGSATVVTTAQEFADAIADGAQHVHITKHLDLRGLPGSKFSRECKQLGNKCPPSLINNPANMTSMTVR
jgi:hypothetical protein